MDQGKPATSLFAPLRPKEFRETHWRREPLFLRRTSVTIRDLPTYSQTVELMRSPVLLADQVLLMRHGRSLPAPRDDFELFLDGEKAISRFHEGYTVRILAVQHHWTHVADMCHELQNCMGSEFGANLYLTPPNARGSKPHLDDHDVLVIQLEGRKTWMFWRRPSDSSLAACPSLAPSHAVEQILEPGDLLYLTEHEIHFAYTGRELSLHVTFGPIVAQTFP